MLHSMSAYKNRLPLLSDALRRSQAQTSGMSPHAVAGSAADQAPFPLPPAVLVLHIPTKIFSEKP